jgi:hypothetical protein
MGNEKNNVQDLNMWQRHLAIVLLSILLANCSTAPRSHHWYQLSQRQKAHTIDGYTNLAFNSLSRMPVSYLGEHLEVKFVDGNILIAGKRAEFSPVDLNLEYGHCKKQSLCFKHDPEQCAEIYICYHDDMLLWGLGHGLGHESVRMYRNILWHQGMHYKNIHSNDNLNMQNVRVDVHFSDLAWEMKD